MLENIPSTNCPSNHIHPGRLTASLLIFGDLGGKLFKPFVFWFPHL